MKQEQAALLVLPVSEAVRFMHCLSPVTSPVTSVSVFRFVTVQIPKSYPVESPVFHSLPQPQFGYKLVIAVTA